MNAQPSSGHEQDAAKVRRILTSIADFAQSARRIVSRGRTAFLDPGDDTQRRAGKSLVIDLSAAADDLPEWFRQQHPEIPWREIRATRDFAAHDHHNVNQEVLWRVLETEFPRIARELAVPEIRSRARTYPPITKGVLDDLDADRR